MATPQAMASPQVLFRSPGMARRHSGIYNEPGGARRRNIGEVAGGATADCAAVACCFPCAVVELAVLGLYKVPAGLCKKAYRKNKRVRMARRRRAMSMPAIGFHEQGLGKALSDDASDVSLLREHELAGEYLEQDDIVFATDDADNEMWEQFYANGFWRNSDDDDSSTSSVAH